jgi:3'(2'), 5'-bisphosphate nucleotidase
MSLRDLDDDALARAIAVRAAALLLDVRAAGGPTDDLRAAGDQRTNELILRLLADARPDDPILSEESVDDPARLTSSRVWIVDPLDGTREFGEEGRVDWAVHIALAVDGVAVVGAVGLPAEGIVLATDDPPVLPPPVDSRLRVVTSRTRRPPETDRIATALGAELLLLGSAGAKAMAVVRGRADVYAHAGGQYQWDSCAPIAVARAAGLHVSRLDGSPLVYNGPDVSLPDLLVCRPELAERCLVAVR